MYSYLFDVDVHNAEKDDEHNNRNSCQLKKIRKNRGLKR